MAHCYFCGRQIKDKSQQLRRKVKTGEWVRKRFPKPRAHEVQTHYGMRIVCKNCAGYVDRLSTKHQLLGALQTLVLTALLTIAIYWLLS